LNTRKKTNFTTGKGWDTGSNGVFSCVKSDSIGTQVGRKGLYWGDKVLKKAAKGVKPSANGGNIEKDATGKCCSQ
jgi:hypothetical protein